MANERGNLLDRRKFHMMKSGSPRGMVGGKNEKACWEGLVEPRKWSKKGPAVQAGVVLEVVLG